MMAQNNLDTTTTHDIVDVARAAIARERLRDSITKRMSHLNGPEVKFLTALNNESVTMAALENTVHVLDNDPLYNPALRSDEKDNGDMYAENDGASGVFQESKDRRSQYRRKSSVIEASMWMMSSAKLDGKQGLDGNVHGTPKRRRTNACEFEESVCDFSNREKKQNNQQHSTSGGQQKDPRRMNSRAGDAIDPLLIAIPMETNEGNSSRQSSESRGEKNKVGMDTFTCSQKEKSVSNDEAKTEVSLQALLEPFLCCGMGSITFDTEEKKANEPANDADTEVGSLESKKRFLHLENNESNRHAHLSTWMGSPEDFPILGLGVKGRNDSEDPLDPHVLSPLLMKCLREHFPYALREENFWLKYSMVRDVSTIVIFISLFFVRCRFFCTNIPQFFFDREPRWKRSLILFVTLNIQYLQLKRPKAKYLEASHLLRGEATETNTTGRARHSYGCFVKLVKIAALLTSTF